MKKETKKERQKRIQLTKFEQSTKGSKHFEFIPCKGTLVNTKNKDGQDVKKQINYRVNKALRQVSSTKLGNQSTVKFLRQTERKGRYQPQMITVLLLMRMTKKQCKNIEIDRYHAFKPVKKI